MNETTSTNTLAHEMIARDEQFVGIFFACFAIQYYLHKDMLQNKLTAPSFLKFFGDIEVYASQRVFIKNIIANKKYSKVIEEMQSLFLECSADPIKHPNPHSLFLSRLNKAFLIRQIFHHSDQVLEKYKFIETFLGKDIASLNIDELHSKMWHLPVEQQLLILVRIFSQIRDGYDNKKKNIMASFAENLLRLKEEIKRNPERHSALQGSNLILFDRLVQDTQF